MEMLLTLGSSVCAGLPMFSFLALIWWLDRYDREPIPLLAAVFLWGAVPSVLLALIGSTLAAVATDAVLAELAHTLAFDVEKASIAVSTAVIAPVIEEPAKALVLLPLLMSRHFDNMTDGFVYGAAAGLGFAMTENYLYFVATADQVDVWLGTVFIRTFYSAVMHATATAAVGAAMGWARFRHPLTLVAAATLGLCIAVGMHALWNGLLSVELYFDTGLGRMLDLILVPIEVLTTFVVFQACLWDEATTIRRELAEEAANGLLPAAHPAIMSSWFRRLGSDWVPAQVDREAYIIAATSLAMRKRQRRELGPRAAPWYSEEVERLRGEIRGLLGPAPGPARALPTT